MLTLKSYEAFNWIIHRWYSSEIVLTRRLDPFFFFFCNTFDSYRYILVRIDQSYSDVHFFFSERPFGVFGSVQELESFHFLKPRVEWEVFAGKKSIERNYCFTTLIDPIHIVLFFQQLFNTFGHLLKNSLKSSFKSIFNSSVTFKRVH